MATLEALDAETAALHTRLTQLHTQRANFTSILLSTPSISHTHPLATPQTTRNLENTYRACAGITAYKVRDPDPNAVDNGNVLGVRIEVAVRGTFVDTYHVLFNRPSQKYTTMLKVHKHTIPACIPLSPLVNKYLPVRGREGEGGNVGEQDLVRFGRALRRELVSWHLRVEALEGLRREAGLPDREAQVEEENAKSTVGQVLNAFVSDDEDEDEDMNEDEEDDGRGNRRRGRNGPVRIIDIEGDMAVREIKIMWSNGQTGMLKVTKDGEIEKAALRTADGVRLQELGRKALGRIEGVVQRLTR